MNMPKVNKISLRLTRSKRPGRISAASIALGRFVAAKTSIPLKKKNERTPELNEESESCVFFIRENIKVTGR